MYFVMGEPAKKILFVSAEMEPYLPESRMATLCRQLPQGIQERGREIRAFMPRYGCINERKNQLHEVIRLSGMNIIIGDVDRPLVIKVASISAARIQVYFIDNEDYFRRKHTFSDASGKFFEDNDERAIFFARGVLETVKKLRWAPDIIHCTGWISHVLPLYLKKAYKDDPIFAQSKAKGLAVAMNSGDPTEFYSDKTGFYTPQICRSALENCATADAAVEHIRQLIKARNYQHKKSGSMWFIGKAAYLHHSPF